MTTNVLLNTEIVMEPKMLNISGPTGDMGVIVARFQTPYLTPGHRALIETVRARHKKFAILLGVSRVIPSKLNPLDFSTRAAMIESAYPGTEVHPILDVRSDEMWSKAVDTIIRVIHPHEKIVLYGSRDSFIKHYSGKFATAELDQIVNVSGTQAREEAFHDVRPTEDFRVGVCYATANQYPRTIACVDIAIMSPMNRLRVLLGQKYEDEGLWRFIGGHQEGLPAADAAAKEAKEEAGVDLMDIRYVYNGPIDDWRYRGLKDKVLTTFFRGTAASENVVAGDDIDQVAWHDISEIKEEHLVPEHRVLLQKLLASFFFQN